MVSSKFTSLATNVPTPPICHAPPIPDEGPFHACQYLHPAPFHYQVTINGVTNGSCANCTAMNQMFNLPRTGPCSWSIPIGPSLSPCGFLQGNIIFGFDPEGSTLAIAIGPNAQVMWNNPAWPHSKTDSIILHLNPAIGTRCLNWPIAVLLTPY